MSRIVFDKNFNVLQVICFTKKFNEKITEIYNVCEKAHCPIPKHGFSSAKKYQNWKTKLADKNLSELDFIQNILESFGLDTNNEEYVLDLKFKIFLNSTKESITRPFHYTISNISGKKQTEIIIPDLNVITREDCLDLYKIICIFREKPKEKRNQKKTSLERDTKYYVIYSETERDVKKGIVYDKKINSLSPYNQMQYHPEYTQFEKKYGRVEHSTGENIVSDFKKKYGYLKLVDNE